MPSCQPWMPLSVSSASSAANPSQQPAAIPRISAVVGAQGPRLAAGLLGLEPTTCDRVSLPHEDPGPRLLGDGTH